MTMISLPSTKLSKEPTQKRKKNRFYQETVHFTTNNSLQFGLFEFLPKELLHYILHKLFDSFVQTFLWSGIFCKGFIHANVYASHNMFVTTTDNCLSDENKELVRNTHYLIPTDEVRFITNNTAVDPKFVKERNPGSQDSLLYTHICRSCKCKDFRHYHGQCESCDHIKLLVNCLHDLKGTCKCEKCLFSIDIYRHIQVRNLQNKSKHANYYCKCSTMIMTEKNWYNQFSN